MSQDNKRRILIIDDEPTHRILAKDYLEEAGYIVRLAEEGKRGLKMATTTNPDLVLVDLLIPGMDGFEICKHIKTLETTAHIPVVLVTASREPDVIARGFEVGADDFVTKPVDWPFLADRVGHVLSQAAERRRGHSEKLEMERCLQAVQERARSAAPLFTDQQADQASALASADKLTAMRQSFEAESQALEMRHSVQIEAYAAAMSSAVASARDAAVREFEAERQAYAAEIERWRTKCATAAASARAAAQVEFDNERLEYIRQVQEARQEAETALGAAQESVQAQSDIFASQHAIQIAAVRQEADEQLRALRESSIERQRVTERQHAALMEQVRAQGESQLAEFKLSIDSEIQALSAQYAQQLQEGVSDKDQQLQSARAELDLVRQSVAQESAEKYRCSWHIMQASTGSQLEIAKALSDKIQYFIDATGHNTPLQGMRVTLLEAAKLTSSLTGALGCSRMLAQVLSGRATLNETTFDVAQVVHESAAKLQPLAEMNRVTITTDLPDYEVRIVADQSRIAYVLLSLTMNAIRHSPHGTSVAISLRWNGENGIEIAVEDRGVGIPQSQLDGLRHCLDRPPPLQSDGKLGFGVPLSTALLRLHGGELRLDSSLGSGTVAAMILPAWRQVQDVHEEDDDELTPKDSWHSSAGMQLSS